MIPVLAKQAMILKCINQSGTILSNYECAYALGILCKVAAVADVTVSEETDIASARNLFLEKKKEADFADEKEKMMFRMLERYEPGTDMDEQMTELFEMGLHEENMWKYGNA